MYPIAANSPTRSPSGASNLADCTERAAATTAKSSLHPHELRLLRDLRNRVGSTVRTPLSSTIDAIPVTATDIANVHRISMLGSRSRSHNLVERSPLLVHTLMFDIFQHETSGSHDKRFHTSMLTTAETCDASSRVGPRVTSSSNRSPGRAGLTKLGFAVSAPTQHASVERSRLG